jgi:CheY-like chemotaxis protein
MDGRALYQQIIEYSSDLAKKVVFITGDTARADTARFLESTDSPVLGKPFTIEAIRQLL